MQSVSSRIWTRVAVSISYDDNDDNDYTTGLIKILYTACVRKVDLVTLWNFNPCGVFNAKS